MIRTQAYAQPPKITSEIVLKKRSKKQSNFGLKK